MHTTKTLQDAIVSRRSCRRFSTAAIPGDALQRLLWAAQGITGNTGNRTVPSAHELHPLRLFVAVGHVENREPGLFACDLEGEPLRPVDSRDIRAELQACAIDDQPWLGQAAAIITVCADFVTPTRAFADQPPYGTRAMRYVHIESGAAAQNMALQAAAEELGCVLVAGFHDEATAAVLGIEAPYAPVLHLCLGWPSSDTT